LKSTQRYLLGLCAILTFTFSACKKSFDKKTTSITYGYSFGMANSVQSIQLSANLFTFEHKSSASRLDKRCSQTADEATFTDVLNALEAAGFKKLPETYGCPDCADGGAEFIEIENDGKVQRVTYDYNKAPKELTEAAAKLKLVMASFENCKP